MAHGPGRERGSTDGEQGSRWARYRDRAASLRLLAADTRFPEIRTQLVTLALRYERIAEYVEQRANRVVNSER